MIPLRGAAEIVGRLELAAAARVLAIALPSELEATLTAAASADQSIRFAGTRGIGSARQTYDLILLWQEGRVGSRAVFEAALKRLEPGGRLWVVTAMRKVSGPRTPAAHRLERGDLEKAFGKAGLVCDRQARLSAWHVAYRFVAKGEEGTEGAKSW